MSSMAQATHRTTSSSSMAVPTAERGSSERSRNARAQARHRAKRKAYIEQLEETVTKLQTAFGLNPDQVAALPPPFVKIRELQQENERLQKENDDMRRLLGDANVNHRIHDPVPEYRRQSVGHYIERPDYNKKRKVSLDDELYIPVLPDPSHVTHDSRPPPLTIPSNNGLPQSYHTVPSQNSAHGLSNNSSLFNLNAQTAASFHHALQHQQPQTPLSGSSSTSSPPFSASIIPYSPLHIRL
ncbi:hypothetical protein CONPUDRAFT_144937 [Coniophora puteana RWD-64-598 SS2]|uniref:BZIP domain-containing protein n=1 Tax=Coniophora puteana (strain RWD-64-598) TaxID=741705 RepID=A0A5M3MKN7_CONPW|nr:uncharacterized protein CONPUDRAFT_144937 [Coniophora puteana RWD-64-598 SS2]EIW79782.1 hypothetical protein CONPUDRAFT_144937 [Coniophora puteana RWD-64-598 SS2]